MNMLRSRGLSTKDAATIEIYFFVLSAGAFAGGAGDEDLGALLGGAVFAAGAGVGGAAGALIGGSPFRLRCALISSVKSFSRSKFSSTSHSGKSSPRRSSN